MSIKRKYELPYNFDKKLIEGYKLLGISPEAIDCIYVPPFVNDYKTILRRSDDKILSLSYDEYVEHIKFINDIYPNKL